MADQMPHQLGLQCGIAVFRPQAVINTNEQRQILVGAALVFVVRQGLTAEMAGIHGFVPYPCNGKRTDVSLHRTGSKGLCDNCQRDKDYDERFI